MADWYYSDGNERKGPIPKETLLNLLKSGQIPPTELVWTEGMNDWKKITEVSELHFTQTESEKASRKDFDSQVQQDRSLERILEDRPADRVSKGLDFGSDDSSEAQNRERFRPRDRDWGDDANQRDVRDYGDDRDDYDDFKRSGSHFAPHRGGLILTFGILGIVLPLVIPCLGPLALGFSIPATMMGRKDLRAIDRKVMDPLGRGTTQAGFICGIIGMVIAFLILLLYCGYVGFLVWLALLK